jgi:acylphosphatase
MKHFNITIRGKVQAVGFRFTAMETAYRFGVHGLVKNNGPDEVFIEAEGTPDMLDKFVAWCHKGPMGARIDHVEIAESQLRNFTSFEIIHRNGGMD